MASNQKIVFIASSVYESQESMPSSTYAIDSAYLTDEHIETLLTVGAVPSGRKDIPGCDENGHFVVTYDGEIQDNDTKGNLDLVWELIGTERLLFEFTRNHHCLVMEGFWDE